MWHLDGRASVVEVGQLKRVVEFPGGVMIITEPCTPAEAWLNDWRGKPLPPLFIGPVGGRWGKVEGAIREITEGLVTEYVIVASLSVWTREPSEELADFL